MFFGENKRTAFALVYTFLLINGVEMRVREEDAYQFVVELRGAAVSSRELASGSAVARRGISPRALGADITLAEPPQAQRQQNQHRLAAGAFPQVETG